jgi:DNA-binding transcriptional ArsR family regulator
MRNMSSASLSGVATLRALAHPARLDLLDLLRVHEKLTAAECGRLLGTSTKSCSYHLAVLSRQGLVARAAEASADGRERPWRRVVDEIETPPNLGNDADGQARTAAMQVTARRDLELFTVFLEREPGESPEWRAAITVHTRAAVMAAGQLREWGLAVEAVTREHVARARQAPAAGARPVRLTIRGFPQELPARALSGG